MANSKETSFSNTISSTLSLITVVFEDLFEAINIHKEFWDEKEDPEPSITLLNKTNTCDGYDLKLMSSTSKKVSVNSTKNCFAFWWK